MYTKFVPVFFTFIGIITIFSIITCPLPTWTAKIFVTLSFVYLFVGFLIALICCAAEESFSGLRMLVTWFPELLISWLKEK